MAVHILSGPTDLLRSRKYGDKLDDDTTAEDRAIMLAWVRVIDEHMYWSGVIQPRCRSDV